MSQPETARGVVDRDGRLVSADPALVTLNARAGGAIGAPLAVPQLATLARLARRLGILVSRGVIVADDEADIDLWVRAQPDGDNVRLAISGWRGRTAWRPLDSADRGGDFTQSGADWRWETDAALRLTFVSLAAGETNGFDSIAVLGAPLADVFAVSATETGGLPILDALAARQPFVAQPARIRSSGTVVMLSASVRRDPQGDFAGFVGAARQPEVTPALDTMPAVFGERLDRALRGTLGRIIANADSIHAQADGPLKQDYADYAADIANAGRHLLGLVDDISDLQAIERPDFVPELETIDLADVARRAAGLLSVRGADSSVTIARPAPDEASPAQGDFRRTLQILVNLIGNAVRYSSAGEMVMVAIGRDGASATVTVADTGKGIAPEDQARVFEKFERVDPSEPGGNGLGLYIARRLARAMGGDLTVESAPGEGARFTLALPAAQPPRDQDQ